MRPDELYLRDLLAAAESITRFLRDVEERDFLQDELLQSAVLQKLTVIGEAATRVSDDLRSGHPEIEWRTIVGLRNVVVHEYFAVSWSTIFATATRDVPELGIRIRAILDLLGES
ncbi:MAG TPA: DUF86 domain-containing protein [Planctomycetota bacterium]|nr:DUF86 domain-containing protein [Planctomycetota bacterium]